MEERKGFGSNFGFLMAAVGSAVGLGNIWGFPYKMGANGGFTFLLVYIFLGVTCGFIVMISELAMGRKTGKGAVEAYRIVSKKFKWMGWLGILSAFFILFFYCALGGYCIKYVVLNVGDLFNAGFGAEAIAAAAEGTSPGASVFDALIGNPLEGVIYGLIFVALTMIIVLGGVGGGIEKVCSIGMPALFVALLICIIRACTLEGTDVAVQILQADGSLVEGVVNGSALDGLKYMFSPGWAANVGYYVPAKAVVDGAEVSSIMVNGVAQAIVAYKSGAPSIFNVVSTAGGQMFFSLSLGMGAMITYGSYLGKNENLPKNSVIIVISDTLVAIMAGLAVIPAAVANGIAKGMAVSDIKLGGPNLLFATLQDVFHDMGTIGGIFGLIFYALVLIAAISSAISLIEAVSVTFIDHASAKGHERDRNKVLAVVCLAITLLACLVAVDGLGSNGIAPKDLFHINSKADWCADWLDFMDMISEGIAMPLGAMLMSIMVGWEIKPKSLYGEIDSGYNGHIHGFYTFCIKYLCPVIMFFILLVQISTFFGLGWFN